MVHKLLYTFLSILAYLADEAYAAPRKTSFPPTMNLKSKTQASLSSHGNFGPPPDLKPLSYATVHSSVECLSQFPGKLRAIRRGERQWRQNAGKAREFYMATRDSERRGTEKYRRGRWNDVKEFRVNRIFIAASTGCRINVAVSKETPDSQFENLETVHAIRGTRPSISGISWVRLLGVEPRIWQVDLCLNTIDFNSIRILREMKIVRKNRIDHWSNKLENLCAFNWQIFVY